MELLPEIDEKKTVQNVIHFLNGHRVRVLRAGRSITSLQSPQMDGMPKAPSSDNNADNRIVERASAAQEVDETIRAINCLDEKSKRILTELYLLPNPLYNWQIASEIGYSDTRYKEIKNQAYLWFAEAYSLKDFRAFQSRLYSDP